MPIHVGAASWLGKPVWFEVIGPWRRPTRMVENPTAGGRVARDVAIVFILSTVLIGTAFVARRNLRLGRGDRRGASRVAGFMFIASLMSWLFEAHHVSDLNGEFELLGNGLAFSAFTGAFAWLIYVAIEPIVRRKWPDLLISWSRLLAGRFRDPLVGRDVLVGLLVGSGIILCYAGGNALPNWIDLRGMTPAPPKVAFLLGLSDIVGHAFGVLADSVERGLAIMTVLVLGQVLLRRKWLAIALAGVLLVMLSLSGENNTVELISGICMAALTIFVAVRFGILALCFAFLVNILFLEAPFSLDFSRWYAGRGLILAGLVAALAVYAFRISLGGKSAFAGARLDEG